VVGIAQDNLRIHHFFQLLLGNAFYAAGRAHGHEHGRLKKPWSVVMVPARAAVCASAMLQLKL
jgi:hypothetical protein